VTLLNVGAGCHPLPHAVNLDLVPGPGIDVVWDLDVAPWPFPDEHFAGVLAVQVFEHVADPLTFMAEAWRVLTPGGRLEVHVPSHRSKNAFTDPTHRRFCTDETFDYWIRGRPLNLTHGRSYAAGREFTGRVYVAGENVIAELDRLERVP